MIHRKLYRLFGIQKLQTLCLYCFFVLFCLGIFGVFFFFFLLSLLLFQSGYVLPGASLFDLWLQKQTKPFKPKVKGYEEEGRVSEV